MKRILNGDTMCGDNVTPDHPIPENDTGSNEITDGFAGAETHKLIFNLSNDAIFLYGITQERPGNFLEVNEEACRRLGYSRHELLSMTFRDIQAPEASGHVSASLKLLLKEEKGLLEAVHVSKSGRRIPVEISSHVFHRNNRTYILSIARDISERKAKEEEIRNRNHFLNAVIESLAHPFFVVDAQSKRVALSNQAAGLNVGDPCIFHHHEKRTVCNVPPEKCPIAIVSDTKASCLLEEHTIDAEGKDLHMEIHAHPVFDSTGRVTQVIVYLLDVSEQKVTLEKSQQLADIVRFSSDGILITDLNGLITYANPTFQNLTGYSESELLGKDPKMLRSPHSPHSDEDYMLIRDTINNGGVWRGKFYNQKKNGEPFIDETSIFPIKNRETGAVTGYGAVKTDITRRIKLEEELADAFKEMVALKENAEEANRLKSQFLANMSHDIRTPLNAILGFTDLLLKTERRTEPRDFLHRIQSSGKSLMNLINDILDLSKIEARQLDIYNQTFDLVHLLTEIGSIFNLQARQKDINYQNLVKPDVPTLIHGDKWRLHQILTNLLSNAFKFTTKGSVTLETDYDAQADTLRFRIIDTGIGMPVEALEKIFEPFRQVHENDTGTKGTGLGLAICKQLVNLMAGTITVRSLPGEGSVFTVILPACTKDVSVNDFPEALPEHDMVNLKDKTGNLILIAEDNPVNLLLLQEQLKAAGFTNILSVRNGQEAVDAALEHQPDLLLMDIQMPLMDGNQAIALLREKNFQNPIISLSAYAMQEDINRSLNAGAVGYITKPIDFKTFFFRISPFLKPGKTSPVADSGFFPKRQSLDDENLIIKGDVSQRIKTVFLGDVRLKLEQLQDIRQQADITRRNAELKAIAHGYVGNASYFGLWELEHAARRLENSIIEQAHHQQLQHHTTLLAEVLEKILNQNPIPPPPEA